MDITRQLENKIVGNNGELVDTQKGSCKVKRWI